MYAHFFSKTARKSAELVITQTPALNTGVVATIPVANKREARRLAGERHAQEWNF